MKMIKEERAAITERVLAGMRRYRLHEDGQEAYKVAEERFTPHQLGALHRAMRQCADDLYDLDMRQGMY